MPIILGLAAFAAAVFLWRSADAAAAALWPVVVLGVLGLAVVALVAWHRRRMAELQQLHLITVGRYANVTLHKPWPKYCTDCGFEVTDWRPTVAHDDPERSPCMKLRLANDAKEAAPGLPMTGYTAEILEPETPGNEQSRPAIGEREARSRAIVDKLRARHG